MTTIYRIQNKKGQGPYRIGAHKWSNADHNANSDPKPQT